MLGFVGSLIRHAFESEVLLFENPSQRRLLAGHHQARDMKEVAWRYDSIVESSGPCAGCNGMEGSCCGHAVYHVAGEVPERSFEKLGVPRSTSPKA